MEALINYGKKMAKLLPIYQWDCNKHLPHSSLRTAQHDMTRQTRSRIIFRTDVRLFCDLKFGGEETKAIASNDYETEQRMEDLHKLVQVIFGMLVIGRRCNMIFERMQQTSIKEIMYCSAIIYGA